MGGRGTEDQATWSLPSNLRQKMKGSYNHSDHGPVTFLGIDEQLPLKVVPRENVKYVGCLCLQECVGVRFRDGISAALIVNTHHPPFILVGNAKRPQLYRFS